MTNVDVEIFDWIRRHLYLLEALKGKSETTKVGGIHLLETMNV